ncbi:MAG: ComEC/Rec2 family competence protein [Clostridia bacterium]|nr:ComEC/Rec2 family competence protein [Clostridia bacterium]
MARPFAVIGLTLFFVMAVLLTLGVSAAVALGIGAGCLIAGLCAAVFRRRIGGKLPAVVLLTAAVAAALLAGTQLLRVRPAEAFAGQRAEVEALLTEEPEERYGKQYVSARILTVNEAPVDLQARLSLPIGTGARPYDRIRATVMFYLPGEGAEDRLTSYRAQGVYLAAYADRSGVTVLPREENAHRLAVGVISLRAWMRSALFRMLPNRYGRIAQAMILGEKHALTDADYAAFRLAGMLHLLCVSGLHLSIWTLVLRRVLRRLRVPPRVSAVLCMAFVLIFMGMTGFSYSVVRAGLMMLLYFAAELFLMERDGLNSFGFALTGLVLWQPYCVLHVGLLLSALSTLGLILEQMATPVARGFLEARGFHLPRLLRPVAQMLCASAAVFVFTLPVMLYVYGGVSGAMFLSNLVAAPVAGAAILLTATGAVVFSAGWPYLNLPGLLGGLLLKYLSRAAHTISALPHLSVCLPLDASCLLLAVLFLTLAVALTLASVRPKTLPWTSLLLCAVLLAGLVGGGLISRNETRLRVLDVGNGTAVLLTSRNRNYLIGAGGSARNGASEIRQAVQREGGRLRALLLPDVDETDSAYALELAQQFSPTVIADRLPYGFELFALPQTPFAGDYADGVVTLRMLRQEETQAVLIRTPDLTALICFDPLDRLPAEAGEAPVLVFRGDYPAGLSPSAVRFAAVNAENLRGVLLQSELQAQGIPAAATAECGDLLIRARNGKISVCRDSF